VRRLAELLRRFEQVLRRLVIVARERGLTGSDQQVVLAGAGVLVAAPAEPLPQPGGFVEPRLLLVERRQRAQPALVARLFEQDLLHRAGRPPRHAGGAEVEAELVHRALAQLAAVALAQRERLVDADRA